MDRVKFRDLADRSNCKRKSSKNKVKNLKVYSKI